MLASDGIGLKGYDCTPTLQLGGSKQSEVPAIGTNVVKDVAGRQQLREKTSRDRLYL